MTYIQDSPASLGTRVLLSRTLCLCHGKFCENKYHKDIVENSGARLMIALHCFRSLFGKYTSAIVLPVKMIFFR